MGHHHGPRAEGQEGREGGRQGGREAAAARVTVGTAGVILSEGKLGEWGSGPP